jgi:hypothetical protein
MITLAREHLNDGLEAAIRDFVQAMQAACR